MELTFGTGARFSVYLPNARLDEQRIPLRGGEVILMVDARERSVHKVEQRGSHQHPEVGVGGVGWRIRGLDAWAAGMRAWTLSF
jgi:hypothetical protein